MIRNLILWDGKGFYLQISFQEDIIRVILRRLRVLFPCDSISRSFNAKILDEILVSILLEHSYALIFWEHIKITADNSKFLIRIALHVEGQIRFFLANHPFSIE